MGGKVKGKRVGWLGEVGGGGKGGRKVGLWEVYGIGLCVKIERSLVGVVWLGMREWIMKCGKGVV